MLCVCLITTQSSARSARAPRTRGEATGPTTATGAACLRLSADRASRAALEGSAIRASCACATGPGKPTLHDLRCTNRVVAATVRWPNSSQEVVQVGSDKTKGLLEGFLRTCHEKGNQQHTAGQIFATNAEEEESHHAIGGILHMQIGEGKKKRTQEQASAKDEACEEL